MRYVPSWLLLLAHPVKKTTTISRVHEILKDMAKQFKNSILLYLYQTLLEVAH